MLATRRTKALGVLAIVSLLAITLVLYRSHTRCTVKNAMLVQQVDALSKEANEQLRMGSEKPDVLRFFETHNMHVRFANGQASGSLRASGCMSGCDSLARIEVSVTVDTQGTVDGQPHVSAAYVDCI